MVKGGNINKALILYAMNGQLEDLRRVIQKGANVDTTDLDSRTALIHAAHRGYTEIVETLLQHGANTSIRDCDGHTAGEYAIAQGHARIADALAAAPMRQPPSPPPPSSCPRYDINEILTREPYDALCELCGALESAGGLRSPGALNHAESAFLAAFNCWGGIECDGLNGWLFNNSDPQVFKDTVAAFRTVGASRRADALWQVSSLFPGSVLPDERGSFAEVISSDEHDEFFREIEEQMRDEDIQSLLHRYVTERVDEFR